MKRALPTECGKVRVIGVQLRVLNSDIDGTSRLRRTQY